jgi:hypothetical protein
MRDEIAPSCPLADLMAILRVGGVIVLSASWDEGWTEGREVFALGGYVFTQESAVDFCGRWRNILSDAKIEFFHMTDFLARRTPYNTWKDPYRRHVFNNLVNAIHSCARYQIVVVVSLTDLESLSSDERSKLLSHTEYSMAAHRFIGASIHALGKGVPTSYVYDRIGANIGLSHVLNEFVDQQNKGNIALESYTSQGIMQVNPELQAADILVHESANAYRDFRSGKRQKPSHWGTQLIRGFPRDRHIDSIIDLEAFRSMIAWGDDRGGYETIDKRPKLYGRKRLPKPGCPPDPV